MPIPIWQRQPCPEWCTATHEDSDHPDDRSHRDDGIAVPIILRRRSFAQLALVEHVEPGHMILGRWQRDGQPQSWRFLGIDDGLEIEISEESFGCLLAAMQRALG